MKKVTRITTLEITEIYNISDEEEDAEVTENREPETHHKLADFIKKELGVDSVKVTKVQSFVAVKDGSNG